MRNWAFFAAIALFAASQSAQAGLIEWTYSSSAASASNPSIASAFVGEGGNASNFWIAWVDFVNQPTTSESGSGRVSLGSVYPFWQGPAGNPPTGDRNFNLTLNLTDSASQMSGSLVFSGYFVTNGPWMTPMTMEYTSPSEQSIVLGGNRYDVTLPYQASGSYVNVSVAAVLPTPEPATIIISIMGLGGLCLFRKRAIMNRLDPTSA
jgi:PEP-CTERM motif-containing protein